MGKMGFSFDIPGMKEEKPEPEKSEVKPEKPQEKKKERKPVGGDFRVKFGGTTQEIQELISKLDTVSKQQRETFDHSTSDYFSEFNKEIHDFEKVRAELIKGSISSKDARKESEKRMKSIRKMMEKAFKRSQDDLSVSEEMQEKLKNISENVEKQNEELTDVISQLDEKTAVLTTMIAEKEEA